MSAYSLKQLRSSLDPACFPPSASDSTKNALINKAREAIYNCGESGGGSLWKGTVAPVQLVIVTQPDGTKTVTLPRHFETIEGVYGEQTGTISPRNQWFSYLRSTPKNAPGSRHLDDLGDGFCGVLNPATTGSYFKVKATGTETTASKIEVYGIGPDGNPAHDQISVPNINGAEITGTVLFTSITEVIEPLTNNDIIASLRTDGADTFFARYEAGEVNPCYRRYRLAFNTQETTLSALCKRRFVPLDCDNDPVDICNLMAMECALRAYRFFQASDLEVYRANISEAVGFLNGELARSMSDSEMVTVQMEPSMSMGRISNIP